MGGSIKIDLGSALPFLAEKFSSWFGKDDATQEKLDWFNELQRISYYEASRVQCIGMHTPVSINEVYQPTRLQTGEGIVYTILVKDLLKEGKSTIVKAGPGYGKTTFLHYVFISQIQQPDILPILISLRKPSALEDMTNLIDITKKVKKKKWLKNRKVLLLVDGYDEIDYEKQVMVSELLMKFESMTLGYFFLTCRKFYDVYYLRTTVVNIAPFSNEDQIGFTTAFLRLFDIKLTAHEMINELRSRRMDEFLAHPLLLALVCIIKSNPTNPLSNSVLELAANAVDTLSFKWDMEKGVSRHSATPLSGKNRVDLLSWMAFKMENRAESGVRSRSLAEQYLTKLQWTGIDPIQVLTETAKFYGIFVPYETGWVFVHKVLHDFLAARYWVTTGSFRPSTLSTWNARAAYAACLQPDATGAMKCALRKLQFASFAEMLMNSPAFDQLIIAVEFINAWRKRLQDRRYDLELANPGRNVDLDYFAYASSKFLNALIWGVVKDYSLHDQAIIMFAILEIAFRKETLDDRTYEACLTLFNSQYKFEGKYRGDMRAILMGDVAPGAQPAKGPLAIL